MKLRPSPPSRLPHLVVEYVNPASLRPDPFNARKHGAKQIEHLKTAILQLRYLAPPLVDEHNQVWAGNGRLQAALELGFTEIPVFRIKHLTHAQLRVLALADNQIAQLATWDEDILRSNFGELKFEELDFAISDVTGFEAPYIDRIVHGEDFPVAKPADDVAHDVGTGPPITQAGDIYAVGRHRILCGDARSSASYAALMQDQQAAAVVADGPYNVPIVGHVSGRGKRKHREFAMGVGEMSVTEFIEFNRTWLACAADHVKDGALCYAFMDGLHLAELIQAGRAAGLDYIALCTWAKPNGGLGRLYRSQTEHVAIFKRGSVAHTNNIALGRYGRNRTTLWSYPGMNSFGKTRDAALKTHPTVKPVAMLSDIMLDATKRDEIVIDPFIGSGSTIVAAERSGRCCYGIEIDPLYVDAALDRYASLFDADPVRLSDGAAWSSLKEACHGR